MRKVFHVVGFIALGYFFVRLMKTQQSAPNLNSSHVQNAPELTDVGFELMVKDEG